MEQVVSKVLFIVKSDDKTGEGVGISISKKAACLSHLVKSMLEDDPDDDDEVPEIPLREVSKDILELIVEFLNHHENDPMKEVPKPITTNNIRELVGEWDADFIDKLDINVLFSLTTAANYMDIPSLLDLTMTKLACLVKGKTVPEVMKALDMPDINDSPEEQMRIVKDNPWIFKTKETDE